MSSFKAHMNNVESVKSKERMAGIPCFDSNMRINDLFNKGTT